MFEHSVKVPRHYKIAANILKKVSTEGGSVKTLLYDDKLKHFRTNVLYALITETIKHAVDIEKIFESSGILAKEPRLDPWLAKVLTAELLFGKKALPGKSKPIETILSYKEQFETFIPEQDDIKSKVVHRPRYVRINTNLLSTSDAIRAFQDEGYKFIRCTSGSYDDYLQQIQNLTEYDFTQDYHVKTMFVFAPGTKMHEHDLYLENQIILQDKATALAVHLMAPPPGSVILDMCAAPGMKTTQLAAYIRNQGKIYAVERNENRYETLCDFVERTGSKCVETLHKDALEIKRGDCEDVEYILLDPSCSGSGMDLHVHNYIEDTRLARLTSLQEKFLKHAMNSFPNAKRIVYSTCSLFSEENERVITNVVKTSRAKWRVQDIKEILKGQWNNFGSGMYGSMGTRCLYAIPESDLTTGFFVAVLDRDAKDLEKCQEENKCKEELNGHHKIKKSKNDYDLNNDTISKVKEEIEDLPLVKEKRKKDKKIKQEDDVTDSTNSFLDVSNKKLEDISFKYENDKENKYNGHKTIKSQKNADETDFDINVEMPDYCEGEIKQKRKKDKKEKHKDKSDNIEHNQNNTETILQVNIENNDDVRTKKKNQKRKGESSEDLMLIDHDNVEIKLSKNNPTRKQDDEISDCANSFLDVSDNKAEDNNENKFNGHRTKKNKRNPDETNFEIKVEVPDVCEEGIKRKSSKNKKEKHKDRSYNIEDSQNNTEIISEVTNENNIEVTTKKKKRKRESSEDLINLDNSEIKLSKNNPKRKKNHEISEFTNSFSDVLDKKSEDSEDILLQYEDNNENKCNGHRKKKSKRNPDETNFEIKVEVSDDCEDKIKWKRNKDKKEKHKDRSYNIEDSQNNTEIISEVKNENNIEGITKKKKQKRKRESSEDFIDDYNNEIKVPKNKPICDEDIDDDIVAIKAKKKKKKTEEQISNDIIIGEDDSIKMKTKESDVCFEQSYDTTYENNVKSKKKKKKDKIHEPNEDNESINVTMTLKDIDKKCKKKKRDKENLELNSEENTFNNDDINLSKKKKNKSKHSEIIETN